MTIRIVFSRRRHIGTVILRGFLWSKWSHCAIIDGDEVIEAAAPDGPGRKPTITRDDLIAAALRLLGPHRSVSTLSLREIAREAGIAPNSFYRQFHDMDELAVALIDVAGESLRRIIGDARKRAVSGRSIVRGSLEIFMERLRAEGQLTEDREYRNLFALHLNTEGGEPKAIEVINEGLQKGVLEGNHQTYLALGQAYYFSEQVAPAIDAYQKAAPLAENGETYLNLARILFNEDRIPEAKQAAQQALDKGVRNPDEARKLLAH